jgi:hypothetical protein
MYFFQYNPFWETGQEKEENVKMQGYGKNYRKGGAFP